MHPLKFYVCCLALNCIRLLTRILPYIFEEPEWRGFFWSDSLVNKKDKDNANSSVDNL